MTLENRAYELEHARNAGESFHRQHRQRLIVR